MTITRAPQLFHISLAEAMNVMVSMVLFSAIFLVPVGAPSVNADTTTSSSEIGYFPLVDTNQGLYYDNSELIDYPAEGEAFYGQDAQYAGNQPSYTDNGDGTVTDNVTSLVWKQEQSDQSMDWYDAPSYCESLNRSAASPTGDYPT